MAPRQRAAAGWRVCLVGVVLLLVVGFSFAIRIQSRVVPGEEERAALKVAIFAMGSFWRSEAVFGCLPGVVRTAAGYAGGSKENPEFRNLGEHAESVQVVIMITCHLIPASSLSLCFCVYARKRPLI